MMDGCRLFGVMLQTGGERESSVWMQEFRHPRQIFILAEFALSLSRAVP